MRPLLNVRGIDVHTLDGRALFRDLSLQLGHEKVALVGRNGVGKSTLLEVLDGARAPTRGRVEASNRRVLVPQHLAPGPQSLGEARREAIEGAFQTAELLLLDEPSQDLDAAARAWLLHRIHAWRGGLVVVSHDPELLGAFHDFFVVAESGCRHVGGGLDALMAHLDREAHEAHEAHARTLHRLAAEEDQHHRVAQRRRRKKAVGRLHELDRNQSRLRLNLRKGAAQVSQARVAGMAAARIAEKRAWALASRRALAVSLPLSTVVPTPEAREDGPWIRLEDLAVDVGGARVVQGQTWSVGHDRVAIQGPNGAGKSTLLQAITGSLAPSHGRLRCVHEVVGSIHQGASDWMRPESLLDLLGIGPDEAAERMVAHRFPLALAQRPLASLSAGERTRAALIALFDRPRLQVLVLDEPTASLDLLGVHALTEALCAWTGGLVVASHDGAFLEALGCHREVRLGQAARRASHAASIGTPNHSG